MTATVLSAITRFISPSLTPECLAPVIRGIRSHPESCSPLSCPTSSRFARSRPLALVRPQRHLSLPPHHPRRHGQLAAGQKLDVLIVTGDAYVDHPAFGPILIARFLEGRGLKVGVVAQPRWQSPDDIARMGTPRLFVGISAGNLDSMLNKLSPRRRRRARSTSTPPVAKPLRGPTARRSSTPTCAEARFRAPPSSSAASPRPRFAASPTTTTGRTTSVRSILLDAKANLMVFRHGRGSPPWEIARRLDTSEPVKSLTDIRGTAHVKTSRREWEPLLADTSRYVTDKKLLVPPRRTTRSRETSERSRS